jgi:hypothetical protein
VTAAIIISPHRYRGGIINVRQQSFLTNEQGLKQSNILILSINKKIRLSQGLGRPRAIGASKSIVAHWGLLSMRPCAHCKFWLIILLFHVSIKVVFYFVSFFCQSSLIVNFPLMAVPWFSLSMFRTVICVNQSDIRIHSFHSKFSIFKTHLSWHFVLFSE